MKNLILGLALVFSTAALADGHRMFQFDYNDYKLDGLWKSASDSYTGSTADDETDTLAFNLNYAQQISSTNWMWQAVLGWSSSKNEQGSTTDTETETLSYGVGVIYNFAKDFKNTWYAGVLYKMSNTEYTDKLTASNTTDNDTDTIRLSVGKRMSFGKWGPASFSYSPSISYAMVDKSGTSYSTYDDGTEISLNLLKIDVLW